MNEKIKTDFQEKYRSYSFRGRRKNEEIIVMLRRHWLIFFVRFIPAVVFLVVIFAFQFGQSFLAEVLSRQIDYDLLSLAGSFLWMFWWLFVFITWIDYYFDVWIVTDQRVVNIEQKGLFRREISELEHDKIQDVTTEVHGLIPTLFKFGLVFIQTAGEKSRFLFKQVPDPMKVRSILMQLQKNAIRKEQKREGEIMRGKL